MFGKKNDDWKSYADEQYRKANDIAMSNSPFDKARDCSSAYHSSLSSFAERNHRIPTPAEKRRYYEMWFVEKKVVYNDRIRMAYCEEDAFDWHLHKKVRLRPDQREAVKIPEDQRFLFVNLFNK